MYIESGGAEGFLDQGATFFVSLSITRKGGDHMMAENRANDIELTLAALAEHRLAVAPPHSGPQ